MAESKRDPIPEHFTSIEDAADFWDTHDLADYEALTEDVSVTIDIQRHRHLVALAPDLAARINRAKDVLLGGQ